jgi:PAS domain S-box-containing protein
VSNTRQGPPTASAGSPSDRTAERAATADVAAERLLAAEARVAAARRARANGHTTDTLNGLVALACRLVGASSGQVSLLADVQYVAGGSGAASTAVGSTGPLADSLCTLTASDRAPLALQDARLDERAAALGPVLSGMVRGYLGVPLADQQGHVIGSLCVFDAQPRTWSTDDVATLQVLGRAVATELAMSALVLEHEAERLRWTLSVDAGEVGSFDYDLASGRLVWDARLQELFGYADGDFDGTLAAFTARLHRDDVERVSQAMDAALDAYGDYEAEYRVVLPGGETRWMQARGKVLCDETGTATRLLGAAYDTTDVHQPRTGRMLEAMPSGFLSMDTQWRFTVLNAAAERLIGHERGDLLGRSIWEAFPDTVGNEFEITYRRAVETQTPQTIEAYYPVPLNTWYEVLAWPTPDGLSLYFADINARKQAAQEAERSSARLALQARVNAELLAAADVPATVSELPRLLVPLLADGCVVTLLGPDGRPQDLGCWHADPAGRDVLERYTASRLDVMPAGAPVGRVLATGQPVRSNAAEVRALLPDSPARDLLLELDAEDAVVLPIPGRDRVLGTLSLFSGAARPRSTDDESTAQEVANRVGLALDNARLAQAQSQLAEGLQRNLLTAPPEPGHAHIVVRYVPASESARVGGDWYDAFMQPSGTTMLVIGDVVGHDVEAAAAMAQLRSLLRGIATYGDGGPAEVLRGLDSSMELLEVSTLATAAVARLEQTAEEHDRGLTRLVWANAGHPPPLVIHPDGRQEFLTGGRADLLLGVDSGARRTQHVATLARGTTVLLYTDGLVERRTSDLDAGLARLHAAVRQLADRSLDELCDGVIDRLVDGRPDDDVALVAVRLHSQDRPRPAEAGPDDVPARLERSPGTGSR